MFDTYLGYKIVVDDELMSTIIEDWSDVRSPSRAKRRRQRGFRQRIKFRKVPKQEAYFLKEQNTMIMHSHFLIELEKKAHDNRPIGTDFTREPSYNPRMDYPWGISYPNRSIVNFGPGSSV